MVTSFFALASLFFALASSFLVVLMVFDAFFFSANAAFLSKTALCMFLDTFVSLALVLARSSSSLLIFFTTPSNDFSHHLRASLAASWMLLAVAFSDKTKLRSVSICPFSIGTLDGGYNRTVPLPRAPRLQRAALAEKCTATFFPSKCMGTFWNHE